jgi:Family of unknown function (DUF6228)
LGHAVVVETIVLDGQDGRTLTLCRTARRDSEAVWAYEATLAFAEASATTIVYEHGNWLGPYLRELAEAWNGFNGVKEYGSLEGQLHLACTHDGRGTVECRVTLRQPWRPEWRVEAVLEFGAGAHLERLASDVEAFVESSA